MPDIHILSSSLRNKIAAGEVVERPASVVKELIENSLDAGSTNIEIDVSRPASRLIRVADNGRGMDREDALLCTERHATSKLAEEADLLALKTLGFRGEALASIAAVSRMRIATGRTSGTGTCIEISGGVVQEVKECSAAGTIVEVKDLFYNTPGRRKFMKSDATESFHIIDTVTREAISHHAQAFALRMSGTDVLRLPRASSPRERILQIFGKEFLDTLVEGHSRNEGMDVTAFLARGVSRRNRSGQMLFINRRPCRDISIAQAVCRAYADLMPRDRQPVFLIFLECAEGTVDFNVHPTKREVRFSDGSGVVEFVFRTARSALHPRTEATPYEREWPATVPKFQDGTVPPRSPSEYAAVTIPAAPPHTVSERLVPFSDHLPCVYLGDTFVALPTAEGLTILDYHAAHERVNYERFLKRAGATSWRLLFPRQVRLQPAEYRSVIENLDTLRDLAIDAEDFGHQTVLVRGVPEGLQECDIDALMSDVAAALIEGDRGGSRGETAEEQSRMVESSRRRIAAKLACHSALRGKAVPDSAQVAALLTSLGAADDPDRCPHGRPTRLVLSLEELRRRFRK
jgi:DNA mismatch repair protein MutL